mgnify:CR=1 FL=1
MQGDRDSEALSDTKRVRVMREVPMLRWTTTRGEIRRRSDEGWRWCGEVKTWWATVCRYRRCAKLLRVAHGMPLLPSTPTRCQFLRTSDEGRRCCGEAETWLAKVRLPRFRAHHLLVAHGMHLLQSTPTRSQLLRTSQDRNDTPLNSIHPTTDLIPSSA